MDFQEMAILQGDEKVDPQDLLIIRACLAIFERNEALNLCKRLIWLYLISAILAIAVITSSIMLTYALNRPTPAKEVYCMVRSYMAKAPSATPTAEITSHMPILSIPPSK